MSRKTLSAPQKYLEQRTTALTIAVGMLKGGTAKSTSVIYLALWWSVMGAKVCVVDTDTNSQSLWNWFKIRQALDEPVPFTLIRHHPGDDIGLEIDARSKEYDVVLVDLGGGDKEMFMDVCKRATLLLIPVAPSGFEISRLRATFHAAENAALDRTTDEDLSVYVLLVKCPPRSTLAREQRETLLNPGDGDPYPVLPEEAQISNAVHYPRAWEETPKVTQLEEYGRMMRHALEGMIA